MSRVYVRVTVFDAKMSEFTMPRGSVYKWTNSKGKKIRRRAAIEAPARTGRMARSLREHTTGGTRRSRTIVRAHVHYGIYVHEGTDDSFGFHRFRGAPPGPKSAGRWTPGARNPWPRATKKGVQGQRANPFLMRAMVSVMGTSAVNARWVRPA